jgi:hypothetical protein
MAATDVAVGVGHSLLFIKLAHRTAGARSCAMALKGKPGWTMKLDRELIALAKSHPLEAIADKLQRPQAAVLKRAKRLGLPIAGKAKGK